MRIHLSSDEVNVLLQRYLLENGYVHSAFAFQAEAAMHKNPFWLSHQDRVPPNALVSFLQKALLFIYLEYHTDGETGEGIACEEPFSLFRRHECWSREEDDAAGAGGPPQQQDSVAIDSSAAAASTAAAGASSAAAFTPKAGAAAGLARRGSGASTDLNQQQHAAAAAAAGGTPEGGGGLLPQGGFPQGPAANGLNSSGSGALQQQDTSLSEPTGVAGGSMDEAFLAAAMRCKRGTYRNTRNKKRVRLGNRTAAAPLASSGASWEGGPQDTEEGLLLMHDPTDEAAADVTPAAAAAAAAAGHHHPLVAAAADDAAAAAGAADAPADPTSAKCEGDNCVPPSAAAAAGDAAATAAAAAAVGDACTLYVGPPEHKFEDRVAVRDLLRLVEHSNVGEAGALSEWSPTDPQLIITKLLLLGPPVSVERGGGGPCDWRLLKWPAFFSLAAAAAVYPSGGSLTLLHFHFAVGPPRLYRVPLAFSGYTRVSPLCELAGPPIASGATNPGSSAHWRPDGRLLATGYESGHISVWTSEGLLVGCLRASETSVICIGFSASGSFLAAACADGQVVVWSVVSSPPAAAASPPPAAAAADAAAGAGELGPGDPAAAWTKGRGSSPGTDSSWAFVQALAYKHQKTGNELLVPRPPFAPAAAAGVMPPVKPEDAFGPGSPAAAAAQLQHQQRQQQYQAGEAAAAADASAAAAEVATLRWNAAGKLLAIVDSSCVVGVWDVDSPEKAPVRLCGHLEPVIKAEWATTRPEDETQLLITVGVDRLLLVWDASGPGVLLRRIVYEHPPTSLRVSRDGSRVAVGTYDSILRVYSLPSFECLASYVDLQMVIPHITWRSTHDCLAYNVFQMGKTVVLKPPSLPDQQQQKQQQQQQQQVVVFPY
ncbi:hypothetical protein Emed_005648 [Eimeria media]